MKSKKLLISLLSTLCLATSGVAFTGCNLNVSIGGQAPFSSTNSTSELSSSSSSNSSSELSSSNSSNSSSELSSSSSSNSSSELNSSSSSNSSSELNSSSSSNSSSELNSSSSSSSFSELSSSSSSSSDSGMQPLENELEYTLNADRASYAVTGIGGCTDKDIVIPATYKGKPVTMIGERAFSRGASFTSVEIPDSVTTIGEEAFYNCTSLKSIKIPDSVTVIGKDAFRYCSIENATMPTTAISAIGTRSLKTVILTSGDSIAEKAFYDCTSLKNIEIPDSVTSIGSWAFRGCSIEKATIPTMAISAIKNENLRIVNLTSGDSIGGEAFYNCTSLKSIEIPDSVTSIGDNAFANCTKLTNVVIPDSVTTIGKCAFSRCTSITSIVIPDSVTTIGVIAFTNCTSLTSVVIPDSVTTIGINVFADCPIENATMPTMAISSMNNRSLKTVILTSGDSIEEEAFYNCTNLKSIEIPDSVTTIGESAFENCTGLASIVIPDSVTTIGESAFENCTGLASIVIPDSVTTIGVRAFESCAGLTSIVIPDKVTSISDGVFAGCASLTSIVIPGRVTSIGEEAFGGCTSLTSVVIPDSVTTIGDYAFEGCTSLTSVVIPDSVTKIGEDALCCNGLTNIYYKGDVEAWEDISIVDDSYLTDILYYYSATQPMIDGNYWHYENGEIVVWEIEQEVESLEYTLNADEESYTVTGLGTCTGTEIVILAVYNNKPVTAIGDRAFEGYEKLKLIRIPNSVTTIGEYAFYNCARLVYLSIPDSVTTIGKSAFENCFSEGTGTVGIGIPDSVTTIGDRAFYNCTKIVSVEIGNGVTSMGYDVFYNCPIGYATMPTIAIPYIPQDVLKEVVLTSGTSIEGYLFYGRMLTTIVIPKSVTSIGVQAFDYCTNLTTVYYEGTEEDWANINIHSYGNDALTNATLYYYSETQPTVSGNYWYYRGNTPIIW